jgi:hypothetical protein
MNVGRPGCFLLAIGLAVGPGLRESRAQGVSESTGVRTQRS